jgi:hypothetical protein
VDPDTYQKLNASVQKAIDKKFSLDALDEARDEGRKYLAGHDELLERFDAIFRNREGWEAMHQWATESGHGQTEPFPWWSSLQ